MESFVRLWVLQYFFWFLFFFFFFGLLGIALEFGNSVGLLFVPLWVVR